MPKSATPPPTCLPPLLTPPGAPCCRLALPTRGAGAHTALASFACDGALHMRSPQMGSTFEGVVCSARAYGGGWQLAASHINCCAPPRRQVIGHQLRDGPVPGNDPVHRGAVLLGVILRLPRDASQDHAALYWFSNRNRAMAELVDNHLAAALLEATG